MTASLRTKKHKCGDVREDGMIFWAYLKHLKSGEYWITKEKYGLPPIKWIGGAQRVGI